MVCSTRPYRMPVHMSKSGGPVGAEERLEVVRRVPARIEDHDTIRRSQVHAHRAAPFF